MSDRKVTTDDIADAIIGVSETVGICDSETAKGFKTSKKKDILKSGKEGSFGKFIGEIGKRQRKKN